MRFRLTLLVGTPKINKDYRKHFLHIFKEGLKITGKLDKYYSHRRYKRLNWNVRLRILHHDRDNFYLSNQEAILTFSTSDPETYADYLEAVTTLQQREKSLQLFGSETRVQGVEVLDSTEVKANVLLVNTVGNIVVQDLESSYNLNTMEGVGLLEKKTRDLLLDKFEPEDVKSFKITVLQNKYTKALHYRFYQPCNNAKLILSCKNPKILTEVLLTGLGDRTSAGFGMLEVTR